MSWDVLRPPKLMLIAQTTMFVAFRSIVAIGHPKAQAQSASNFKGQDVSENPQNLFYPLKTPLASISIDCRHMIPTLFRSAHRTNHKLVNLCKFWWFQRLGRTLSENRRNRCHLSIMIFINSDRFITYKLSKLPTQQNSRLLGFFQKLACIENVQTQQTVNPPTRKTACPPALCSYWLQALEAAPRLPESTAAPFNDIR